jgi:6,7-dimethyl-8-ribityllumazine synthase
MPEKVETSLVAQGLKFAIVASRFNEMVTGRLIDGAVDALVRHGVADKDVRIVRVPGSFEIPLAARRLAASKKYNAVLCLGALVRGETPHFEYLAAEVARSLGAVALETGVPVIFGVLTTDTLEQAIDRAGGKGGNKGWDAALAGIEMANLLGQLG